MFNLLQRLSELADPAYKSFQSGLLPGVDNILGVRLPLLRQLAKEIIKEDAEEFLQWRKHRHTDSAPFSSEPVCYEEVLLEALVISSTKMSPNDRLSHIAEFVPQIDSWAVCDIFCSSLKDAKVYQKEMWLFLKPYLHSPREFELRFGIVMLLNYYITDLYIDRVITILHAVKHDGYYVKMAVAWALSFCFIKFPEKTMAYFRYNQFPEKGDQSLSNPDWQGYLDDFTYNKALQKTCESLRIDKETKQLLRAMKRPKQGQPG